MNFRFPRNEIRRIKWLNAIGLTQQRLITLSKYAVVCSVHFTEDLLDRTSACGLVRLRDNAIPNIKCNVMGIDAINETFTSNVNIISNENVPSNACPTMQTKNLDKSTQTSENFYMDMVSQQTLIMEVMRLNTLYKSTLQELRNTRKKQIRQERRVPTLKNILAKLWKAKLLSQDNLNVLSNLKVTSKELRQLRETRKYSPHLQKFAIILHVYSPKAYSYVRNTFRTCLPHPRALSEWYSTVDNQSGFAKEAFEAIKLRSLNEQIRHGS
ncbi:hypothetical protein ILUMI_07401 [Ignelater luminosus]|uniref:THAP-type domain-containing protein n=1 Tax=Ignelater luminosus TaxID=2038154 RepID=A0A8K0GI34_IGNLU|nr:hypothetical protein ILUMI_07401 [Ignelater luminosus]